MGVLSKLLISHSLKGAAWGSQAAAPLSNAVVNASRAYATGSDYTIIDHEYDAVVVGAGGAFAVVEVDADQTSHHLSSLHLWT